MNNFDDQENMWTTLREIRNRRETLDDHERRAIEIGRNEQEMSWSDIAKALGLAGDDEAKRRYQHLSNRYVGIGNDPE
ncbi:hypothetical protein GCM10029978_066940 [Actinoallomurus acanthiterrae]